MSALRVTLTLLLSVCALLASSCGEAEAGSGGSKKKDQGVLVVENASSQAIRFVYFSEVSDDDWGDDRLGSSETIRAGRDRSWDVQAGRYHVKVELADGQVLDSLEEYDVRVGEEEICVISDGGGAALENASYGSGSGTLRVENDSSSTIFRVYFSPTWDENWGADRLGSSEVMSAGFWREWGGVAPGRYHVKVEFGDGRVLDSLEEYVIQAGETTTCTVYDSW